MPQHAAGPVTVVTGPLHVDLGPVVQYLAGRLAGPTPGTSVLGDGLAVRVIDNSVPGQRPNVTQRTVVPVWSRHAGTAVDLDVLPSAWADPDTNLAVVFRGPVLPMLTDDLDTLDRLGHDVKHRLTIGYDDDDLAPRWSVPAPVEVGGVGTVARDSVLRAGAPLLIEAGHGQDVVQALTAVGIQPWATYVGSLDIWLVASADVPQLDDAWLDGIRDLVRANGGPGPLPGSVTMHLALTGVEEHLPGLSGWSVTDLPHGPGDTTFERLSSLLDRISMAGGMRVRLVTTGRSRTDQPTAVDLR